VPPVSGNDPASTKKPLASSGRRLRAAEEALPVEARSTSKTRLVVELELEGDRAAGKDRVRPLLLRRLLLLLLLLPRLEERSPVSTSSKSCCAAVSPSPASMSSTV
jgi:hypothetical protein